MPMTVDKVFLATLTELEKMSSPAPWEVPEGPGGSAFVGGQRCVVVQSSKTRAIVAYVPKSQWSSATDHELIVAMRNGLPALLEEIARLQKRVFELEELIDGDGK